MPHQPSLVFLWVLYAGSLKMLVFVKEGKTEFSEKNPQSNNKLNPHKMGGEAPLRPCSPLGSTVT